MSDEVLVLTEQLSNGMFTADAFTGADEFQINDMIESGYNDWFCVQHSLEECHRLAREKYGENVRIEQAMEAE